MKMYAKTSGMALLFLLFLAGPLLSQQHGRKIGYGLTGGAMYLFGDADRSVAGFGGGVLFSYQLTNRLSVAAKAGYGTFGFRLDGKAQHFTSNIIYGNLALDLELTESTLRPFLEAGVGGFNFKAANTAGRFFDAELLTGAGVRWFLTDNIAFSVSATGKYTSGDYIDGIIGGGKDMYLTVQTGFAFFKSRHSAPKYRRKSDYFSENTILEELAIEPLADSSGADQVREETATAGQNGSEVVTEKEAAPAEDAVLEDLAKALQVESTLEPDESLMQEGDLATWLETDATLDDTVDIGTAFAPKQQAPESERAIDLVHAARPAAGAAEGRTNAAHFPLNTPAGNRKNTTAETRLPTDSQPRTPFEREYQNALTKFEARDYAGAIETLQLIFALNPDHPMASNCEYWIGESYYGMRQYEEATQYFEHVLQYSKSYKKDDALLMRGLSYLKLGKYARAADSFHQLLRLFPDSEYAGKAQLYLNKLQT